MSLNAATIAVLLAKGLSGVDILDVARAMETTRDVTNAERQARYRKRKKESNGVTVTRDALPNDIDILTPPDSPVISNEITPPAENDDEPVLKPEHVVEAWNEMAARTGLPAVRKLTPKRAISLRRRITENTIQDFTEAIDAIERSPFLRGERGNREWRADFDFLLSPEKFNRILEGAYG